MKLSKKRIAGLVSVAAVAAFALVFAVALPQTASAHGGPGGFDRGFFKGHMKAGPAQGNAYLADALGITAEELQEAREQAAEAGIDQAVADGLLTQERADQIKEHAGRFMGMIGKFGRFGGASDIDHEALLADALGITVEELQDAQAEAKDAALAQAIADGKITQEKVDEMKAMQALRDYLQDQGLQDNVRSLYADALQGAVEDGVITQEQADKLLEAKAGFRMKAPGKRGRGMPNFDKDDFRSRFNGRGFAPRGGTGTAPTAFSF